MKITIYLVFSIIFTISSTLCRSPKQRIVFPDEGVPRPKIGYECGQEFKSIPYHLILNESVWDATESAYFHNKTADDLRAKGFDIQVEKVLLDDVLCNFTYTNGSFVGRYVCYDIYQRDRVVGGQSAPIARAYYMAQLGQRRGKDIVWLCDGVLINEEWILSAAHCFVIPGLEPNMVRLGDHNLTDPFDPHLPGRVKVVFDYPLSEVVPHPEFNVNERYNDFVLLRIPRRIPKFASNVRPICLPWGIEAERNFVGTKVVLTGWGATQYGGQKTPNLQAVDLKVFETSVCEERYRKVPDTRTKYSQGITADKILCVGWEEDGRDACGGDSGAPIAYSTKTETYSLLGIVSGGFGCGLKEFPGLYMPINKKYLEWIKRVAFKSYV